MPRPKSHCTVEGCEAQNLARGLCRKHYTRWQRYGDPAFTTDTSRGRCTVEGCVRPHKAHGWCDRHYRRWQRHGSPLSVKRIRNSGTAEDRWWARVKVQPNGCWLWQGNISSNGYGGFGPDGKTVKAHRWGYERFVAKVPKGMELDHLCRNRACVRFDHLEPVTRSENLRRGYGPSAINRRKTHCPQGHAYSKENTYVNPSTGFRHCRACKQQKRK